MPRGEGRITMTLKRPRGSREGLGEAPGRDDGLYSLPVESSKLTGPSRAPPRSPPGFREFLHQLQEKCAEEPEPLTSPAPQHQRGVLEHCPGSPRCPNCSFLPDLWGQSSHLQDSLTKISLQQTPILGPLKGDHSQFTTVRKANHRPHGAQVPRLKAALTHNPSGEGSRPCRQRCPFRVRFADETLQDTTLRYWERRRSVPTAYRGWRRSRCHWKHLPLTSMKADLEACLRRCPEKPRSGNFLSPGDSWHCQVQQGS
eukprot:XP_016870197.1 uncharacterized protein C9orf50 isoform X5 [Homo sapiens]